MKRLNVLLIIINLLILTTVQKVSAQWVQTNGPIAGRVLSLAVDGLNIYAGCDVVGDHRIYKSTNNGESWNPSKIPYSVSAIAVNNHKIYAGTYNSGLYISTDDGNSFNYKSIPFTGTFGWISSFAFNGSNTFAGTYGCGVYLSTDEGNTWNAVNNGLTSPNVTSLAIIGSNLLAGTDGGIFISTNNGAEWTMNSVNNASYITSLAVSGTKVFAASYYYGIYVSINNGADWSPTNNSFPNDTYITSLAVIGTRIYAGSYQNGVFFTTNDGASWNSISSGMVGSGLTIYSLAVSGSNVFAGTLEDGIYRSTNNGINWYTVNNGLACYWSSIRSLGVIGSSILAGSDDGGIYRTTNNGSSWDEETYTWSSLWTFLTVGSNIFAGGNQGQAAVFLSADNGNTWNLASAGLPSYSSVQAIISSGLNLFAGTGSGVYISNNNGVTWSPVNNGLPNACNVLSLAICGNYIFAGTYNDVTGIYRSSDNGNTWSPAINGLPVGAINVSALAVSGTNIFASTSYGIYLSTDNGENWNSVNNGINGAHSFFINATNIFAATDGGVFLSPNNGKNWYNISEGLINPTFAYLYVQAITLCGNYLYAGLYGSSVWKRPLSDFGSYAVSLTALIQGLYNNTLSMVSDTITLELHNSTSPYSLVESQKAKLDSNGTTNIFFNNAVNGTPYYLVIKHRNAVETWSSTPQTFTSNVLAYDFTTDQSLAYGNNLVQKGNKWCIYSGDVNQDGIVDSGDLGIVDNDNANYVSGYTNTDVNGDGIVDSSDLGIVDNNNANYVGKIIPSGTHFAKRVKHQVIVQNKNIK